jgi:hypothetical protein
LWEGAGDPEVDGEVFGKRVAVDHEHRDAVFGIYPKKLRAHVLSLGEIERDHLELGLRFDKIDGRYLRDALNLRPAGCLL